MKTKLLLKTGQFEMLERMVFTAILALILTAPIPASAGSARQAKGDDASSTATLGASLMADPVKSFERHSFIRDYLDKHLFPDTDKQAMDTFAGSGQTPSTLDRDMLYLSGAANATGGMSLTEREIRESAAKDEAYKVMSNMLFSLKAISRLRDAIEPYTRPLELYRDKDGAISPNYFGQSGAKAGGVKVFAVDLGISSSHNINVMMNIYDRFNVSLLDGTRLIMQYATAHGDSRIGIEADNSSELLLTYSLNF